MQIYTAETLQQEEAAAQASTSATLPIQADQVALDETSVTHFCSFVDFYTRQCTEPFNTSLACEKQLELVKINPQDATQETVQMLLDTMLDVIDHLEKKWLDEQIKLDDRKRRHREDVARLHQQLVALHPKLARERPKSFPVLQRILRFFTVKPAKRKASHRKAKTSRKRHAAHREAVAW